MLSNYLSDDLVEVVKGVSSINEAINLSGNLLKNKGFITHEYIDSMKSTYDEFGPYMVLVDGVALFHGKPRRGVNKSALSLVVLKEWYKIPDSDKKIKLCFSFSSFDNDDHMNMIKEFASLLMDQKKLALLLDAESKEEVMSIINEEDE